MIGDDPEVCVFRSLMYFVFSGYLCVLCVASEFLNPECHQRIAVARHEAERAVQINRDGIGLIDFQVHRFDSDILSKRCSGL